MTILALSFGGAEEGRAGKPLLARIRDILDRHGAWIEVLKPAEVVAVFGLGETDGRDAEAAVRAGLVLVRERRFDTILSAGVHSGPISVDGCGGWDGLSVATFTSSATQAGTTSDASAATAKELKRQQRRQEALARRK